MKTRWKQIAGGSKFFLAMTLLTALAIGGHVYAVLGAPRVQSPPIQLSRIDFQETVDSLSANRIKSRILQLPGVQHAYFNIPDAIVVYSHDPRVVSAQRVYEDMLSHFALKAERFIPTAEMSASSCPITGKNSLFAKIGAFFKNTF